jgi:hypothetical protein
MINKSSTLIAINDEITEKARMKLYKKNTLKSFAIPFRKKAMQKTKGIVSEADAIFMK